MNKPTTSAIAKAVELSSVAHIAASCGVTVQAVYKWLNKGYPPVERCEAVERSVEGRVSRFDLLPPAFAASQRPRRNPPSATTLK